MRFFNRFIGDSKKQEQWQQIIFSLFGSFCFAFGVNTIITPLNLYNGGFMGIAQLIRTILVTVLHLPVPANMDIAGIVYYIMNIPLFYYGYKILGKDFTVKTVLTVTIQSVFLSVIPVPQTPVFADTLTSCIIGGLVVGFGTGLIMRGRSSGGGQDIVGMCFAKTYPNVSVGTINIIMNVMVYSVCLFMFNIETVIYSLIYTTILAMTLDRVHIQNINTSAVIFTKKTGVADAILAQTGRGVTKWEGKGAYTQEDSHILYTMISKYEVSQIRGIVRNIDPDAFMIFTEGCQVDGHFEKRL